LSLGIDIDLKNARGHTPLDLATDPDCKRLINDALKTSNCVNCQSEFDFKNLRYLCLTSGRFFCSNCSNTSWDYELPQSDERERPCCRSIQSEKEIRRAENAIKDCMEAANNEADYFEKFKIVDEVINSKQPMRLTTGGGASNVGQKDLDVKLMYNVRNLLEKLRWERDILDYISPKRDEIHAEDYQTILKSVNVLKDKVESGESCLKEWAEERPPGEPQLQLDDYVLQRVNHTTERYNAERNLRFKMS